MMIKPVSSACNMRCKYCFYRDVSNRREQAEYGRMSQEIMEASVASAMASLTSGDRLSLVFQGGEPTLAGQSFFAEIVQMIEKTRGEIEVSYALQTNGLLLNEEWADFLAEHDFLVGLSLDGYRELHDDVRPDAHGMGTYTRVRANLEMLCQRGVRCNVLSVLTREMATHPEEMYRFLRKQGIRCIQFVPCLGELEQHDASNPWALTPESFGYFYRGLFQEWMQDLREGRYISIKLFDDIIHQFAFGCLTACGISGNCRIQYVVESDGSVYPCDFYALDAYRLGNVRDDSLKNLGMKLQAKAFMEHRNDYALCRSCQYRSYCRGGCPRMKNEMYVDVKSDFCGYRTVLDEMLPHLNEILSLLEAIA